MMWFNEKKAVLNRLKKQSEKENSVCFDASADAEENLVALLAQIPCRERSVWPQFSKKHAVISSTPVSVAYWERPISGLLVR